MSTGRAEHRVGPFLLDGLLGSGATGAVYRAVHVGSGVGVALKVLNGEVGHRARRLLLREVEAAARLDHAGIVWVHDFDDAAGAAWVALELLTGGSLAQAPPPHWTGLRDVMQAVLLALGHAHAREVLHRDVKPQNILLGAPSDARPGPKLVDFGIAAVGAATGVAAMTPDFAAPEVLGRGDEGPWSDLYAFGATVWWLCCGVPRGDRAEFRPRYPVSPELEGWLRWLGSHRPADRPARAARALEELRRLPAPRERERPSTSATWDHSAEPPRALATHPRRSPASLRLLPLRTPPVVGRATELAELNRWTTSGEPQVCVLTGVRGSGRRHLARAFAAAAAERDSAWVVPIDPSSPAPLTAAVRAAHHPELAATTEEDAFEALARFAASADRPVVAVVQPGSDGEPVDLVTRLALVPSLRILTMATSAAGHPAWRGIELGPVDPYELGRRLGLQAGLTERLAVVAHGHPGTTLDLVAGLARSGRLTADSSGIGLAVDEPLDPPAEPAARARAAVANLPPSGSIRAAALLRPLPGDVWRALLGALGLEQDEDAAAWSRAGLVRQADGTPWFHDPAVRGIVADSIPEAERARIFEAAAAATEGRPELDAEHAEWAWRARRAGAAKLLMAAAKRHLAPRREVAWRLHRFLEENRLARGVDLDALMNNGVALKVNTGDLSGALTELDELPRPQSAVATALRVQVLVRLGNIVEASTWFSTLPPTEGTAHWDLAMVFALHANDLERAAQLVEGRSGAERERLALALALATNDAAGFRAALARHRALEGGLWADAQEALGAAAGLTPAVSRETLEAWALQALARPYPYLHTLFCACLVAWAVQHAPDEVAVRLATCTESAAYTGARQHWVRDVLERVAGFSGVHEAAIRALAATQGPI